MREYHSRYLGSLQTSKKLLDVYRIRLLRDIFFGVGKWPGRSKRGGVGSVEMRQRKRIF